MEDGEFLQGITKQLQDCLHPDMLDIHCGGKSIGLLTLYDICIHKFNAVSEIVILLLCYFVYTSLIWSENLQKKIIWRYLLWNIAAKDSRIHLTNFIAIHTL